MFHFTLQVLHLKPNATQHWLDLHPALIDLTARPDLSYHLSLHDAQSSVLCVTGVRPRDRCAHVTPSTTGKVNIGGHPTMHFAVGMIEATQMDEDILYLALS